MVDNKSKHAWKKSLKWTCNVPKWIKLKWPCHHKVQRKLKPYYNKKRGCILTFPATCVLKPHCVADVLSLQFSDTSRFAEYLLLFSGLWPLPPSDTYIVLPPTHSPTQAWSMRSSEDWMKGNCGSPAQKVFDKQFRGFMCNISLEILCLGLNMRRLSFLPSMLNSMDGGISASCNLTAGTQGFCLAPSIFTLKHFRWEEAQRITHNSNFNHFIRNCPPNMLSTWPACDMQDDCKKI